MTGKRKRFSAEFEAKVAPERIRGELPVSQLVAKHRVRQTLSNAWKKPAIEWSAGCRPPKRGKIIRLQRAISWFQRVQYMGALVRFYGSIQKSPCAST